MAGGFLPAGHPHQTVTSVTARLRWRAQTAPQTRHPGCEIMTSETLVNGIRRIGFAAAWFCTALAFAVFVVLLVADHDPLPQAAQAATPLAIFALLGALGAGMTRYLVR
jgi:hypothetical protein